MLGVLHERQPDASCISGWVMERTAFAMIRRAVSPMPIGRTPGCLLSAMRRHARSGPRDEECTHEVLILMATDARGAEVS